MRLPFQIRLENMFGFLENLVVAAFELLVLFASVLWRRVDGRDGNGMGGGRLSHCRAMWDAKASCPLMSFSLVL